MDFDQIMQLVITLVIAPLLTWGVSTLIALLNAKIAQIKNETIRKALIDAQGELQRAVMLAVTFTQETFVNRLEGEGPLTPEEAKQAFEIAFNKTKEIMSNASMEVIETATEALNDLIQAQIENTLKIVKAEDVILADTKALVEKRLAEGPSNVFIS